MTVIVFTFAVLCFIVSGCSQTVDDQPHKKPVDTHNLLGKKILLVDSYHPEYVQSMLILNEIEKFAQKEKIELQVVYLDEKHKKSDDLLRQAAINAKNIIDAWQPDVLIAADDPASQYVVSEYYRDVSLPVVFVGVNWNVSQYGYPYKNVTGQIEIEFLKELLSELRKYAKGTRLGFITGETLTDRKVCNYYENDLKIEFFKKVFVNDFEEWKTAYLDLQNTVSILLVRNNAGIAGWDDGEAQKFVLENTNIPTGSISQNMAPFVLINYSKVATEFGQYAVKTAYKILTGTPPSDIPISKNKQLQVYLNMPMAKKLNIVFPMNLIEQATFVEYGQADENYNDQY
ncbi:MAG: ABC transporter substrate binding protein [Candidatus Auribacterota bacterium]|jgi:hypothetical protein|nr:ABC transporter substrate binding protein [Candidatus Auribacterota bacterium]